MFFKCIYKLGQRYRNPSIQKQYKFLKESETWSLKQLEDYQLKQLKILLKDATETSNYYQRKIDKNLLNSIITIEDLTKLPILTKELLADNNKDIHTQINFKKTFLAVTSGTSGSSIQFVRNEVADSFNRAASLRGYSWYGVKPWDKNGYFWGINFDKKEVLKSKFLDFLQNRFRIFSYQDTAVLQFIKQAKKAVYIHGYSSMIYQTALMINKLKLPKPKNLKMLKGTSEKVFNSYQTEIKKAFGVKMISEYGATEAGLIAFECVQGNLHINMEGVLVEEINNEILVTNLQMNSFPIIRYALGDYIKLAPINYECSCGMKHKVLLEVTGRIGNKIYGLEKTYPSLYFYYIFKNLSTKHHLELNYQVIQEKKGYLLFLIEQKITANQKAKVVHEIEKYFKTDVLYLVKENADFIIQRTGKLKNFISKINND